MHHPTFVSSEIPNANWVSGSNSSDEAYQREGDCWFIIQGISSAGVRHPDSEQGEFPIDFQAPPVRENPFAMESGQCAHSDTAELHQTSIVAYWIMRTCILTEQRAGDIIEGAATG
nr:hypothetical protein Itr_chr06CG14590 [Ipomoea trifida]